VRRLVGIKSDVSHLWFYGIFLTRGLQHRAAADVPPSSNRLRTSEVTGGTSADPREMGCLFSKEVPNPREERITTKAGKIQTFLEPSEEGQPARVAPPDPAPPQPTPQEAKGQAEAAEAGSPDPPTPAQSRPPPPTPTAEDPQGQGQQSLGAPPPMPEVEAAGDADEVSPLPMRAELLGDTEIYRPAPVGPNVKQVLLLLSPCPSLVPLLSLCTAIPLYHRANGTGANPNPNQP